MTNSVMSDRKQKICEFTIVNIKEPKQKFEIYRLVPTRSKGSDLIKRIERELATNLSGFKVARIQTIGLLESRKETCPETETGRKDKEQFKLDSDMVSASKLYGPEEYVSPSLPKLSGTMSKLDELSKDIIELAGIKTVIFVDERGKALYRRVREGIGSGFDTDSPRIGTIASRAFLLLKTAVADDSYLGETQFIVVGRKEFKAIFMLIQPLEIIMRITVDKDVEARTVSDQVRRLVSEHYPQMLEKDRLVEL